MKKRIFISIALVFLTHLLYSQENNSETESTNELIKKQLTKTDHQKIETIENNEKDALKRITTVDKIYEELSMTKQDIDSLKNRKAREKLLKKTSKKESNAVHDHVKALGDLSDNNVKKYDIYNKDLQKFSKSIFENRISEINGLEKKASTASDNADLFLQKVSYTVNTNELFKIYTEAYKHEGLALLYLEKLYSIYLNWDLSIAKDIDDRIAGILSDKPDVKDQSKKIIEQKKDSVILTNKSVFDTIYIEKVPVDKNIIVYKVQIAASKKQLSTDKLNTIYKEVNLIQCSIEDEWYKYAIGFFSNYQDAQTFKTRTGIPGAFIVAYKDGIRVPITELINHPSFKKK